MIVRTPRKMWNMECVVRQPVSDIKIKFFNYNNAQFEQKIV